MTEIIWAPWRALVFEKPKGRRKKPVEYPRASRAKGKDCLFCRLPTERADRRNLIVHRAERCYLVLNRYPYMGGHLMVIPYEHTDDLAAMAPLATEMFALAHRATEALRAEINPEGFNLGLNLGKAAGAGIPGHGHLHLVPRWLGDHNFMPVLSNRRVLNESLDQVYRRLRPHFEPPRKRRAPTKRQR